MAQVFGAQGAEVQVVGDAPAALVLAGKAKFDGIFLELNLVGMDGVELTQRIRRSSWNTRTPIVLVGRNPDAHAAARGFEVGGTFFLPRPLSQNSILRALISIRPVMLHERRRYRRIGLSSPLQCFVGARELAGCVTRNLSSTGMLFDQDGTLHPHDKVRLLFRLERGSYPVMARALVIWVDAERRAGVRFTRMSDDDRERLRKRIAVEVDNL
jgi:CheY-like chemotaxis protein